jgi:hypothetical protein
VEGVIANLVARSHLQQRIALRSDDAGTQRVVLSELFTALDGIILLSQLRLQLAIDRIVVSEPSAG